MGPLLFCGCVEMWKSGEGQVSGLGRSPGSVAKYYRPASVQRSLRMSSVVEAPDIRDLGVSFLWRLIKVLC